MHAFRRYSLVMKLFHELHPLLKNSMIPLQHPVLFYFNLKLMKTFYSTNQNCFYRKDNVLFCFVLFYYSNLFWIPLAFKRPTANLAIHFQMDTNGFGWQLFKLCLKQDSRNGSEITRMRLTLWPKLMNNYENYSNNIAM